MLLRLNYLPKRRISTAAGLFASAKDHHEPTHAEEKIERQLDSYRPGSDSYAYENPWPKLNKGRLDWLFQDGWRRPLASDQGGKMRSGWMWYGQVSYDEYKDWLRFHRIAFLFYTGMCVISTITICFFRSDWPAAKEWALREAHLEMARREKAGLPYISKDLIDPKRIIGTLPAEEELRDFDIII